MWLYQSYSELYDRFVLKWGFELHCSNLKNILAGGFKPEKKSKKRVRLSYQQNFLACAFRPGNTSNGGMFRSLKEMGKQKLEVFLQDQFNI